jgi:hypothetical protein
LLQLGRWRPRAGRSERTLEQLEAAADQHPLGVIREAALLRERAHHPLQTLPDRVANGHEEREREQIAAYLRRQPAPEVFDRTAAPAAVERDSR